jgi:hypothetical protein
VLVVAALLCVAAPVRAAAHIRIETQPATTGNGKPAAALVINGAVVARIAKDEAERPPLRQISLAATLLANAYRSGRFELKPQADKTSRRWVLFLNGEALLVASDQEAKAWGVEPQTLVQTWQSSIEAALRDSPPPPPGTSPLLREPAPPSALTPGGAVAARPAPAALAAPAGNKPATPPAGPVKVQNVYEPPDTTEVVQPLTLPAGAVITGSNPSLEVVNAAVTAALRRQLQLGADDSLTWRQAGADPGLSVPPGQSRSLTLDYTAGGASGTASVPLQNTAIATPRESLTLFSNDPESVYAPQLLYAASLPAGRAARLVYHHQCQADGGLRLVIRVLSESDPGALHVVPGTAQPDVNTFYIGFKSAENFWNNLNGGSGYALPIASGGQAVLLSQQLARGYTGSGYMKLTNLGAQPLRLEVLAVASGTALPHGAAADAARTAHCVFDSPYFSEDTVYAAGDPWLYLRLGDERPQSATDESVLHGCYGMTHSFNVRLSNPGAGPATAYVVLRASAGEVKGQFYINGEYISTPLVTGGEEQVLKEVTVPPGESRWLRIKALALNGGFYPASVIVRDTRYP